MREKPSLLGRGDKVRTAVFGKRERKLFGKIKEVIDIPNLIHVQLDSYRWFIEEGMLQVLRKYSPIVSQPHKGDLKKGEKGFALEFLKVHTGKPRYTVKECMEKGITYSIPIYVTVRITDMNTGEMKEEDVFFGYIPGMTERGTFVINGAERVVVNQLVRSPGLYFVLEESKASSKNMFVAHFLPVKGAWFEILLNPNKNILQARIDRGKRVNFFLLLKVLGFEDDVDILRIFRREVDVLVEDDLKPYEGCTVLEDVVVGNEKLVDKGTILDSTLMKKMVDACVEKVAVTHPVAQKTYDNLVANHGENITQDEAYLHLFKRLRPNEIPRINAAKNYIYNLYFNEDRFELSEVGRYKVNKKLAPLYEKYCELMGIEKKGEYNPTSNVLTKEDIVMAAMRLMEVSENPELLDTKDHLGNKRVRTVGELMQVEFEKAFARMHRLIQDKLTVQNSLEKISAQSLVNARIMMTSIHQFFATSQLSQFMDQVNPLAELTHKRRLSAIGPGGLKREHARFEVRDVHHSHYGRMCPIETPEGANIGLITSLAAYATVDEYGFLITPYRKVVDGRVTDEIYYLTADEEEDYNIAGAAVPVGEDGEILTDVVEVRHGHEVKFVKKEEVDFMAVSPKQIVSVSTSLIPFLEHDDANRALMGSNMQRQAVPLIKPEAPFVATGMESVAAKDSGYVVLARNDGVVKYVSADKIVIQRDDGGEDEYHLLKFVRTNQDTTINQRPIVNVGDKVKKDEPIADGPATCMGELALGKNVLVAFVPWEGYNFEDAILVSQELLEEDTFTSIHIEMFETQARETRLGPEEITADIPNVSKESLRHLDADGIARIGAYVTPGDILVGKVTPKGESEMSPEDKIMRSLFAERGKDVKDSSLKVPHGVEGKVIDVKVFERDEVAEMTSGVLKVVRVYVASRKTLDIGDKLAGRHGNKGVVSMILAKEDMPFLPDGTPVQMVVSPLGVPSRMNLGQVLETHLGWLAKLTNTYFASPIFDGAKEEEIMKALYEARVKAGLADGDDPDSLTGKVILRDGRTGLPFEHPVVVGYMYMMKLIHIAKDKIHARSTGPYSLIHQQPLGGKAQFGGQRFGEMEVWALEAHGASYTLNEMLTIKSDDIRGRNETYKAILKGLNIPDPGIPESFKVLVKELQGLALDVKIYDKNGNELDIDKL